MNKLYFGKDLEAMSFAQNYHCWILEEFRLFLGGKMAEIGAGAGNFSDFLLSTTVDRIIAFEPSENMFPILREKFKGESRIEVFNSYFEDKSGEFEDAFDSICYVNVLEHVEDHERAMEHAYRSLRKGGHLLILVPALQFLYSDLDRNLGHFRRYTKSSLEQVVSSAGFTIKKSKYFDFIGIFPWYLFFKLMKRKMHPSDVSAYDKICIPLIRRVETILTPPIGKNLLLIGRK